MYEIEGQALRLGPKKRFQYRLDKGCPEIFEELEQVVAEHREATGKSSDYFKAIDYAFKELPFIRRYLKNGVIELDNNHTERAFRPFAVGRRNWLFIVSEKGAHASAAIYSLIMTASSNGLNLQAYMTRLVRELPKAASDSDLRQLLPY